MTVSAVASPSPDRLLAFFRARCKARALLFAAGDLDLIDAVDGGQADAVASGLVGAVGQDEVQRTIATAFERVRR